MEDQEKTKEQLIQELQECRERNDFLQAILDGAPDMIQVIGVDGSTIFTSRSIEKLFGYTLEEALSVKVGDLYPPEDMAQLGLMYQKLIQSTVGTSIIMRHRVRHKDGHWVFLETHVSNQLCPPLNGQLAVCRDISNRDDLLQGWEGVEESLETIYNSVDEAILVHDREGRIAQINEKALNLLGVKREAGSFSLTADKYYEPDDKSISLNELWDSVIAGQSSRHEWIMRNKINGQCFNAEVFLTTIRLKDHDHVLAVIKDVTEKKEKERQLKNALEEKEALLKETHHRIKNNFGVIVSLLRLQSKRTKEEALLEALKETEFRIRCMGFVHEKLHESESLDELKVRDYLNSLIDNLVTVYGAKERQIKVLTNMSEVSLSPKKAIPLGFITSELVSNSFKHAFKNGNGGIIKIDLNEKDQETFELKISDNGSEPGRDLNMEKVTSLGLNLVRTFVNQLNGSLELDTSAGTEWTVSFKTTIA